MQDFTQPIENELISDRRTSGSYSYTYFGHFCRVYFNDLNSVKPHWSLIWSTACGDYKKSFKTKKEALKYFITEINYTL
jgi:hypothetical protein